ncbi:peptidoglycan-binding protein, partial [Cellulomonas carbonis T26]
EADLAEARLAGLTPLPAGEVVYLPTTPRRVDTVDVQRGSVLAGGAAMRVSGARLQIAGTVSAADAELLEVGSPAVIAAPDGSEVTGTVEEVGGGEDDAAGEGEGDQPGAGRTRVVVVPTQITEEQRAMLQGSNVRITIPVTSTTEAVLAVPLAALDTGPGGEARVDVLDDDGASSLVTVRTGLAADGFVEVTAVDGELAEGDRVVVGTSGEAADDDATGADEGGEDGG